MLGCLVILLTASTISSALYLTLDSIIMLHSPCPINTSTATFGFSSFVYAMSTIAPAILSANLSGMRWVYLFYHRTSLPFFLVEPCG